MQNDRTFEITMSLSNTSIGIKTFLRDDKLFTAIGGIQKMLPEVKMIIADCGEMNHEKDLVYASLERDGHTVLHMPFDAGFGAMSNAIVKVLDRPYLLTGSDDFDFRPPSVREGLLKMVDVLEHTDVDVAGGRVAQHGAYEFTLNETGGVVTEHHLHIPNNPTPWYVECDLTVNYCLCKRRIFEKVGWDDDVKIGGGEHGAFFVDVKRAGFKVAFVLGAEIYEQKGPDSERYRKMRMRSADKARPCFDRRGIRKYVLGGGQVDYERRVAPDVPFSEEFGSGPHLD